MHLMGRGFLRGSRASLFEGALKIGGLREPGLAFTPPAKSSPADDGLLAASEVAGMRLSADWVILSACVFLWGLPAFRAGFEPASFG